MEAVRARGQRLSLHLDVVRDREKGVLVRSASPWTALAPVAAEVREAVGDQLPPDLSAAVVRPADDAGARVVDLHGHRPESLRDGSLRVVAVGRKRQALGGAAGGTGG